VEIWDVTGPGNARIKVIISAECFMVVRIKTGVTDLFID